jgi:hypothetical protein
MVDIFVEKTPAAKPSFDIGILFNRKNVAGDLGLEIEVEGKNLPHEEETPSPWLYKHDGSLRGEDNAEYVLGKPIAFDKLPEALDKLWAAFKKCKSTLDDSNRTSVHVHLNCQRFHLNRLTSFMAMYFCVEDLLTHWCGEHRVGNLFCLRAKDAPAIVSQIKRFLKSDQQVNKYTKGGLSDHLHYSGLNAHALTTFGSLEVRTLRGVSDPKTILEWVAMLQRLYDLSASFTDPRQIIEQFSEMGPLSFFSEIMGPMASVLRRDIPHDDQQVREAMFEGTKQIINKIIALSEGQGQDSTELVGMPVNAASVFAPQQWPPMAHFDGNEGEEAEHDDFSF